MFRKPRTTGGVIPRQGPRFGTVLVPFAVFALVSCASLTPDEQVTPAEPSPYLLVSAGDADRADSDFLAVIDLRAGSPTLGTAISTLPTGMKASMPHHMEYETPPADELLFLNAHHHEMSLLLDVSNPRVLRVGKTFMPPAPLRYPHDYTRTPKGKRLVGFLRSEGRSIDPSEIVTPGNHGGIAEYSADGNLLRQVMAGNAGAPDRTVDLRSCIQRRGAGRLYQSEKPDVAARSLGHSVGARRVVLTGISLTVRARIWFRPKPGGGPTE